MLNRAKKMAKRRLEFCSRVCFLVLCLFLCDVPHAIAQQGVMASRLEHADKEPQNWLTFYGNYKGWSYSPLSQITRENVKQLAPVWALSAGVCCGEEAFESGAGASPPSFLLSGGDGNPAESLAGNGSPTSR